MSCALLLAVLSLALPRPAQEPRPTLDLAELCAQFAGHDQDGDGQPEIEQLELLEDGGLGTPLVVVLVEARLLQDTPARSSLEPELRRFLGDLVHEAHDVALVAATLASGGEHRDGLKLLALRSWLRALAAQRPLGGVVLVGRFPDAFLVRTCNWRKHEALTLHRKTERETDYGKVRFVRRVPEAVAHRCDIVLADLDGNWEERYVGPRVALPAVHAVFAGRIPKNGGVALDVERSSRSFEDFFHVADGRLEIGSTEVDGQTVPWVTLDDDDADQETTPAEAALPNRIAQPEIFVSRIDASGIALSPDPELRDTEGRGLLDAQGRPQELHFDDPQQVPSWSGIWVPDPALEGELLRDYFERNHRYRRGLAPLAFRPASIACDLGSGYRVLRAAAPEWADLREAAADQHGKPTLVDFVDWLSLPAVLRTVRAHSDPWGSVFGRAKARELDALFADTARGAPLSWTPDGRTLRPSLAKAAGGGKLDFFLLRSLWGSGLVAEQSALYLHTGCHGISPPGAANHAYDHPSYGRRAGGESLLFYGQGLAMVGRAKVFYDEPRGFAEELAAQHTIGAAWARYFAIESQSSWSKAGGDIGRKRSYFWSVLGDWTLRLRRPQP